MDVALGVDDGGSDGGGGAAEGGDDVPPLVKTPRDPLSLLTPRDETDLVRLLGSRGSYDAMLRFLRRRPRDDDPPRPSRQGQLAYLYTAAIAALASSSDVDRRSQASELLDEMDRRGMSPKKNNSYTFTALLLSVDGGRDAARVVDRARQYGEGAVVVGTEVYNAAIHACGRRRPTPPTSSSQRRPSHSGASVPHDDHDASQEGWQMALLLYHRMLSDSLTPNERTYASLLHACGPSGQVRVAKALLERMKSTPGLDGPSANVWGAAMRVCAVAGDDGTALEWIEEMRRQGGGSGRVPNVLHYNALLAALAKSGKDEKALEVLEEMSAATAGDDDAADDAKTVIGSSSSVCEAPSPDLVSLNTVLSACAEAKNYRGAKRLLERMKVGEFQTRTSSTRGRRDRRRDRRRWQTLRPDVISYNTVLSACSDPKEAKELVQEMRMSRRYRHGSVRPTRVTYANAISACRRSDPPDLDSAVRFLRDADEKDGLSPNVYMYSAAIWTAEKAGNATAALSILGEMKRTATAGGRCEPNVVSYDGAISAVAAEGRHEDARRLLEEMRWNGIKPTPVTFQKITSAIRNSNETERLKSSILETILSSMDESERNPSIGGSIVEALIRSCSSDGRYDDAKRAYGSLVAAEGGSNARGCLAAILRACAVARPPRWEDALSILRDEYGDGGGGDAPGWRTTRGVAGRRRRRPAGGIDPTALGHAVVACARADEWEEALDLVETHWLPPPRRADDGGVRSRNSTTTTMTTLPTSALNAVIASCGRCKRADVAVRMLDEMESTYGVVPDVGSYRSAIIACNQAEHERRRREERRASRRGAIMAADKGDGYDGKGGTEEGGRGDGESPLEFRWWECALSLLRRMKEAGLSPDPQTYSSVIGACDAAGQWQRAVGVLRSMSKDEGGGGDYDDGGGGLTTSIGTSCSPPNLFCFNAAVSACERGGAWVEAMELYERMKERGGAVRPNFVTLNSLLIALEKAGQRELAQSTYGEAVRDGIMSPWRKRPDKDGQLIRVMDLHQFSVSAKIAVRNALDSLLLHKPEHNVSNDLVIVVGKGKGSEGNKPVLSPAVQSLLVQEFGIASSVEPWNSGRLRVSSEALKAFVKSRWWR